MTDVHDDGPTGGIENAPAVRGDQVGALRTGDLQPRPIGGKAVPVGTWDGNLVQRRPPSSLDASRQARPTARLRSLGPLKVDSLFNILPGPGT